MCGFYVGRLVPLGWTEAMCSGLSLSVCGLSVGRLVPPCIQAGLCVGFLWAGLLHLVFRLVSKCVGFLWAGLFHCDGQRLCVQAGLHVCGFSVGRLASP